ncbi:hypothetical protein FOCC_FOCC007448 [Frankliniella occidentalis]|nr:hypothetical protein FOCC_FOCC007448 [Frankliniella occidentalis]
MWAGASNAEYSQWALNQSDYQNLSHDEIDWAQLAQQWIQMKETFPPDQVPPAPPPPPIGPLRSEPVKVVHDVGTEGGEAPMDMETKEESMDSESAPPHGSPGDPSTWGAWNNWGAGPWDWANNPVAPAAAVVVPPTYGYNTAGGQALLESSAPSTFDYNHGSSESVPPSGGFWAGPGVPPTVAPPHHIPNDGPQGHPFSKHGRGGTWKRGGGRPPARDRFLRSDRKSAEVEEVDTTQTIDAAKRRNLPSWIRDGLEKMEREKQRKLEREQQLKQREEMIRQKIQEEEEALADDGQPMIPKKSKFESDSEEEERAPISQKINQDKRKSRFSDAEQENKKAKSPTPEPDDPPKSKEEILQEVMVKVRRMLTEVLLEVTTEEMQSIAEDAFIRARSKAPAAVQKTPALASLTGKLGKSHFPIVSFSPHLLLVFSIM